MNLTDKFYQPLFELMSNEHNLILTESELDEIIVTVQKILTHDPNN